jgi:hypothetical protein
LHARQPTPIDQQGVIRMNRDTLYSAGVFDLTEPVTILKPDSAGRFQSMMVINQDHSMRPVEHGAGEFTLTQEEVGTRYVIVLWGGNPEAAAMYDNVVPEKNDGQTPYSVTVKEVPVDGFWSITVYNKDGFMEKNDPDVYSYNNVTAKKSPDGSITIHFGRGPDAINNLPITPGWNYIVRMYQPKPEIIDGSWSFPKAQSAE